MWLLFIRSVAEWANSSICTAFSVVKVCSGEVAVLVSLKLYNICSLNKRCKFKVSVVVVDHVLANTVTNSLFRVFLMVVIHQDLTRGAHLSM